MFFSEHSVEVILFWVSKFKDQGHRVSKFISYTRILHTRTAIHRQSLGGVTSCRRGIELGIECLLVYLIFDFFLLAVVTSLSCVIELTVRHAVMSKS